MPKKTKTKNPELKNPESQEIIQACKELARALGPAEGAPVWKRADRHRAPINTPVLVRYTLRDPSPKHQHGTWYYELAILRDTQEDYDGLGCSCPRWRSFAMTRTTGTGDDLVHSVLEDKDLRGTRCFYSTDEEIKELEFLEIPFKWDGEI